jgi:hypothetical protein
VVTHCHDFTGALNSFFILLQIFFSDFYTCGRANEILMKFFLISVCIHLLCISVVKSDVGLRS